MQNHATPVTSPRFAAVPAAEMAFALSLFVEAANRHLSPGASRFPSALAHDTVCALLYRILCECEQPSEQDPPRSGGTASSETELYAAFSVLCSNYDGDPLQASICARVLAFHFLMERTAGAAAAEWTETIPDSPELVALHPAVVEAVASVPLRGSVRLHAALFHQAVAEAAARDE